MSTVIRVARVAVKRVKQAGTVGWNINELHGSMVAVDAIVPAPLRSGAIGFAPAGKPLVASTAFRRCVGVQPVKAHLISPLNLLGSPYMAIHALGLGEVAKGGSDAMGACL